MLLLQLEYRMVHSMYKKVTFWPDSQYKIAKMVTFVTIFQIKIKVKFRSFWSNVRSFRHAMQKTNKIN